MRRAGPLLATVLALSLATGAFASPRGGGVRILKIVSSPTRRARPTQPSVSTLTAGDSGTARDRSREHTPSTAGLRLLTVNEARAQVGSF